jgi:hypothetical protein
MGRPKNSKKSENYIWQIIYSGIAEELEDALDASGVEIPINKSDSWYSHCVTIN